MNEELETLAGCRSDVHGSPPALHGFRTRSVEMEHLVSAARGWFDGGVGPGQIKGLEFRCVAVVGVGAHYVPPSSAVTPATEDQASHDLDVQRELRRSVQRDGRVVSWHVNPSSLLPG